MQNIIETLLVSFSTAIVIQVGLISCFF